MAAPLGTGTRAEETGQEKQDTQEKETVTPERAEEAKLKAKYPNLGQKPGGSDFLMKRLQKGVFFLAIARPRPLLPQWHRQPSSNQDRGVTPKFPSKNTSILVTTTWPRQR
ncbi:alpha-endosulfine isoform X2 [Mycteria americana]|uniref:alpha-endosulfine isoform X2 n=1 Tax=Mycteria americana TaxID=33587 RepID=UPI003F58D150